MKITDLKPALIWQAFDEITRVPRPTHHLDKMREFLLDWARRHNLAAEADEVGNVVMRVPATPGHENAPVVILQGHQDMVAEKRPDVKHDFLTDPITTVVDGEWVRAEGTTLGADNGMGCAAAMACLIDPDLVHGPLEALFTVDEEQGLIGANGLQPGFVTGNILLNLDSEEMGQLVIGCAGGKVTECRVRYTTVPVESDAVCYRVSIGGLKGGHSGMEIGLGRANANQQLARALWEANRVADLQLCSFDGGNLANAIPRDAHAVISVAREDEKAFNDAIATLADVMREEFRLAEDDTFFLRAEPVAPLHRAIEPAVAARLVAAIFACPNGVQSMSLAVPGLIETSCNLASVKMIGEDTILVTVHQRSAVDSRRDEIADSISALFGMVGAEINFDDAYVGWSPNPESHILKVAEKAYEDLFHAKPRVEALHAGLECGLFLEKMPHLDMVSFGPTLKNIHSPAERANIASVADFYRLLTTILTRLA